MMMYYLLMFLMLNYLLMIILIILMNLNKLNLFMMGMFFMFYTMIICFNMNLFTMSYWYSYILFLTMIGGLMVLFIYFVSLLSNLIPMKLNYSMIFFMLFFMIMFFLNKNWLISLFMIEGGVENLFYLFKNNILYIDMMKELKMDMTLYMIFYLFLTMICSVLICYKVNGPLCQLVK